MCLVKNEIYSGIIFKNSLTKISEMMTMGQKRPSRLQVAQKKDIHQDVLFVCGRWDLNPHDCNNHKILSLARLPVPTLPRTAYFVSCSTRKKDNIIRVYRCQ